MRETSAVYLGCAAQCRSNPGSGTSKAVTVFPGNAFSGGVSVCPEPKSSRLGGGLITMCFSLSGLWYSLTRNTRPRRSSRGRGRSWSEVC